MHSAQSADTRANSDRGSLSTLERGEYRPVPDGAVLDASLIGRRRAFCASAMLAVVLVGALAVFSRANHAGAAAPGPDAAAIAHESLDFVEVSSNQWNASDTGNQSAAASELLVASATVTSTTTITATSTTTTSTTTTATTTTTTTSTSTTTTTDLKPDEDKHDGNVCEDSEELFAGLCYRKCSHLTEGEYPIRSTPFSCCKNRPCLYTNEKAESAVPCEGYDVNGKGGCPHAPGACLVDEEYFLGLCYKRCSILTNGSYPYRKAALTCCKENGVGCLNPFNEWTSGAFNVGGGRGDNDTSTPRSVHGPIERLTESKSPEHPHTPHHNVLNTTAADLMPHEHMHDGNVCEDNEELLAGLCYKKCANLTDGEYPVRGTAFSCCKSHPCGLTNQKADGFVPCNGYDIGGHGGCPHFPGACLKDEELLLGICYEKCSLLTHGAFPNRASAATCCKDTDLMDCMNPFSGEAQTSAAFDVAGGKGDHNASTPNGPHGPMQALTEAA